MDFRLQLIKIYIYIDTTYIYRSRYRTESLLFLISHKIKSVKKYRSPFPSVCYYTLKLWTEEIINIFYTITKLIFYEILNYNN